MNNPSLCTQQSETAVVVDGFSSGTAYLNELSRNGLDVIHVVSRRKLTDFFGEPAKGFNTIVCDDVEEAFEEIARLSPSYILCGSEPAIDVVGHIKFRKTCRMYNPVSKAVLWGDKYFMCNALRAAGLPVIPQLLCDDLENALGFYSVYGPKIVVKPVNSAGSDGVFICSSGQDVKRAFSSLIFKSNALARKNTNIICQKFIEGDQYVVNGMVQGGSVNVTDVWRDKRELRCSIKALDYEQLLGPEEKQYPRLKDFAACCMKAMGYKNGPFHMELIEQEGQLYMIETGFRIMGAVCHSAYDRIFGTNHVSSHVNYVLHGKTTSWDNPEDKTAMCVTLRSFESGYLECDLIKQIDNLPTSCGHYGVREPGFSIEGYKSLFDNLGTVYLFGEGHEVMADYKKLREIEKTVIQPDLVEDVA